jgi:hypothetical protein
MFTLETTYSTNGREIYQISMKQVDGQWISSNEGLVSDFLSPEQLWNKTFPKTNEHGAELVEEWREKFANVPFEDKSGTWQLRYYQEIAVKNTLEALANGKERILLTLATGTGKTAIAFQIAWKLFQTRWNLQRNGSRRPRILFLADRNILADQAYNSFSAFLDDALCNPKTGKRVKNGAGNINWVHSILKRKNSLSHNFNLCQCYFGEHLLRQYPNKPVAIVEGEKTAVIGSMIYKDFNWLAAGNLNGLSVSKSEVLKDKYVTLYPDSGCMEKWTKKMREIRSRIPAKISVSDLIEKHVNENELQHGYDLADYIIDNTKSDTLQKMIEINPALQSLIDELGLEEV